MTRATLEILCEFIATLAEIFLKRISKFINLSHSSFAIFFMLNLCRALGCFQQDPLLSPMMKDRSRRGRVSSSGYERDSYQRRQLRNRSTERSSGTTRAVARNALTARDRCRGYAETIEMPRGFCLIERSDTCQNLYAVQGKRRD